MKVAIAISFSGSPPGGALSGIAGPPRFGAAAIARRAFEFGPLAATTKAAIIVATAALGFSVSSAFELQSWRLPFVKTAELFDSVSSSPSGMFWDDLTGHGLFGDGFWPDTVWQHRNYWHLEPSVAMAASNDPFVDGRNFYTHGGALSDIRFGNLLIRERLDVDTRYKNDPDYIWKKDRIAAGRIEEAYGEYDWKYGFVRFGRLARNWGPFADRSVILSDDPHGYDALEWQIKGPFFEFRHLFSAFPYDQSQIDINDTTKTNRYLAAHSLNFFYHDWAGIGITETMLFGRPTGFPDFQLINPFSIYTVINTNGEGVGNLMLGFQGWAHPFTRSVTLKAQVIIDDLQVDHKTIGDEEPNHWGGDFGIYWRPRLPIQSTASLEYHYLSKWLYLVADNNIESGERYTLYGRGLGYPDNDGDQWQLGYTVVGSRWWLGSVGLAYQRRGGNTVMSSWNTKEGWNGYTVEHSLRSDSCEHTIDASVTATGYLKNYVSIAAGIDNRWIKNKNNVRTSTFEYDPEFTLTLSAQYPSCYWQFPGVKRDN